MTMDKAQRVRAIFIFTLAALFLLYVMALQVSPSVMTRDLMYDFKVDARSLGVMTAFYFYSYTLMQIPVGLLFDRFNARTLITSAVFICMAGTFIFALNRDFFWAASGRFLMGIGSSFAFVGALVVAVRWFPARYFALLVGMSQFLAAIGAFAGGLPIAVMLLNRDWKEVMTILGALGVFLTILSFIIIRDSPSKKRSIPKRHHLLRELKEILKSAQTWWIALYAFCAWGPVGVFAALWGVPYLLVRFQVSTAYAAFAMSLLWVGVGLTSPILGWISDKVGKRKIFLYLCSAIGLFCSLVLFYLPGISFGLSFILLFGIGFAASGQILTFALVKDNNRPTTTGTAIGLNNMAVVAGGAVFQPFVGFLLHHLWLGERDGLGVPVYTLENYHMSLIVVPICFFVGLICSVFFIKETYCRPRQCLEIHS